MEESIYVLGIHGNYFHQGSKVHESSACLLKNGKIIAAITEERLTRIKSEGSYPEKAIREVLKLGGITMDDISYVAYSGRHPINANYNIVKALFSTFRDTGIWPTKSMSKVFKSLIIPFRYSKKTKFKFEKVEKPFYYNDHHLSHAASTYFTAPFEKSLVITLDGGGDGLDASVYYGSDCKLTRLNCIPSGQSPCTMYSGLTHDLGFRRLRHEGKLTGLAAYGNPQRIKSLKGDSIVQYNDQKKRFISKQISIHNKNILSPSPYFSGFVKTEKKEDLAAYLQQTFEKVVLEFIKDAYNDAIKKNFDIENIAVAGGAFANVKLNQKILELGYFKDIFVFPAMGDDGLSVGAALNTYYLKERIKNKERSIIAEAYLGSDYNDEVIEEALKSYKLVYEKVNDIEERIGKLLAEGKVVARFEGKMEFGPRALGHRSLIASPFDKSINDWLNEKLNRTEFMPFAPSILAERVNDYFLDFPETGISAAKYMTITCNVKPGMQEKIPAVVHVDGTARPQVVRKETSPSYYAIIKSFELHTGIPVILNTSFNMHEEPIVCTPDDAIRGFLDSGVDYLAIENFLVEQKSND